MKTYFLDTSVIIDYLRGKEETVGYINTLKGNLTSSYICLAELYEGIYRVEEKEKTKDAVLQFFASLSKVYSLNNRIAEQFGELRAELKKKGAVLEDIDILIAATCLVYKLVLVTNNKKHFTRIKELIIL